MWHCGMAYYNITVAGWQGKRRYDVCLRRALYGCGCYGVWCAVRGVRVRGFSACVQRVRRQSVVRACGR